MGGIPTVPFINGQPQGGITVPTGAVPVPQQAPPTDELGKFVNSLNQQYAAAQSNVTKAAQGLVPTSVGSAGVTPGLTMNPVKPFNQIPYDDRQVVGRKNARNQGIMNIVTGAANAVGGIVQKHNEEKQRVLSVNLERIMQATDGMQQAQETLKRDPNNAEAKATLDKNNNIINSLLSDPKQRKQISKALDINFTDPSQNKTPEHGALLQATKSYADQLQAKIPANMQINPQAVTQFQIAQQQAQGLEQTIKSVVPALIRANSEDKATDQRAATARETSWNNYQGALVRADAEYKSSQEYARSRKDAAMIAANASDYRADKAYAAIKYRIDQTENLGLSSDKAVAADQKSLQSITKLDAQNTQQLAYWKQLRDNDPKGLVDPSKIQIYNDRIAKLEKNAKTYGNDIDTLEKRLVQKGAQPLAQSAAKSDSDTNSTTNKNTSRPTQDAPTNSEDYGRGNDNNEE